MSAPILAYPDFQLPFVIEVDASVEGLGAILSQRQCGKMVVIAYASRRLKQEGSARERALCQLTECF